MTTLAEQPSDEQIEQMYQALQQRRIDAAREALEAVKEPLSKLTASKGFGTVLSTVDDLFAQAAEGSPIWTHLRAASIGLNNLRQSVDPA